MTLEQVIRAADLARVLKEIDRDIAPKKADIECGKISIGRLDKDNNGYESRSWVLAPADVVFAAVSFVRAQIISELLALGVDVE